MELLNDLPKEEKHKCYSVCVNHSRMCSVSASCIKMPNNCSHTAGTWDGYSGVGKFGGKKSNHVREIRFQESPK